MCLDTFVHMPLLHSRAMLADKRASDASPCHSCLNLQCQNLPANKGKYLCVCVCVFIDFTGDWSFVSERRWLEL
jgi:hypothetical protein